MDWKLGEQEKKALLDVINLRRSIRDYADTPVSEEDLRTILEAARQAPSGENYQPWRFIVVRDKANKDFLSMVGKGASGRRFTGDILSKHILERFAGLEDEEKRRKAFKKLASGNVSAFVNQADVIVLVLGRKDVWDAPFDTSAAIENMLLAVTACGLGACWLVAPCIDLRDEMRINEHFGVPDNMKTFAIISIGEPTRYPKARPRIPLEDLVYKEKFGEVYYKKEEA